MINLQKGDCLELMEKIPDKSVDMILCDLPYGTTNLKWDKEIPLSKLWCDYNRIVKSGGAIVLFGSQPFTSKLICSNIHNFKHEIIWEKQRASNFMQAKIAPLKIHENILVFSSNKNKLKSFNPQKYEVIELNDIMKYDKKAMRDFLVNKKYDYFGKVDRRNTIKNNFSTVFASGGNYRVRNKDTGFRNPKSIVKFNKSLNHNVHPTQKPVSLLEYLIRTYSNECELILDNTMGSGSTGVACVNTNRNFIGMELDDEYFKIAQKRIREAKDEKVTKLV